jgi:RimJ/RimL family protein N-acetyltransferase
MLNRATFKELWPCNCMEVFMGSNPAKSSGRVELRSICEADLDTLFEYQSDPTANYMAAFTSKEPHTRATFGLWWGRLMANDAIIKRVVLYDGTLVGSIIKFEMDGVPQVSYWYGREYWGRGIATTALRSFLMLVPSRPLHARAAKDNIASRRALEKCGFELSAQERGYANARGIEIEEYVFTLKA